MPDDANPRWSTGNRTLVRKVTELLETGQYERLAELLDRVRSTSGQEGGTIAAHTLDLAHRICLACSQSQAEAEWHQQAREEAAQREDQLRGQLDALLNLNGDEEWSPAEPVPFAREGSPSLWHRIQGMLRRRPEPQPAASAALEAPAQSAEAPVLSSPEPKPESVAVSSVEPVTREEMASPSLVVYCLGPFRVYQDDQLIEKWPSQKSKRIFKFMIMHRERPIHQEILMDLFWHNADAEAARRNLYQAIYSLRQALQTGSTDFPYVLCEDSCYRLNPEMEFWVDCEAVRMHVQDGERLERAGHLQEAIKAYELAENLYQGQFLAEDLYEDWAVVFRENLEHAHLDILDRLSQLYFDRGQLERAISFCQKILAQDNCREDAHRRLMRCHMRLGQRHLALRQYHQCVEALERELDVPPMPATLELYQDILVTRTRFPGSQEELRDD